MATKRKPAKKVVAKKRVARPAAKRMQAKKAVAKKAVKPRKELITKRSSIKTPHKKAAKKLDTRAMQKPAIKRLVAKASQRFAAAKLSEKPTAKQPVIVKQVGRPVSLGAYMPVPAEPVPFARPKPRPATKQKTKVKVRAAHSTALTPQERRNLRSARAPQYNYMKPPGIEHAFEVGDTVEVFCDHEKNSERVRGWVKGIVVQVDNKMVAVQFRSNVFLTDGWMVPDRILWYPVSSDQIRVAGTQRKLGNKELLDY
jgi:hypothetical protein